jgi:hypothetical protein
MRMCAYPAGHNRGAVYLTGMGNRFAHAPDADNVIANQTQLCIQECRHEMLLLRFVTGVFRDNLQPQTIRRLRRVHRTPGDPVLVERGLAHAVQNDSERKVLLRKGIAHAISFQKRNGKSWGAPEARCCQWPEQSEVENGINGGTRRGETVYAGFPESLDRLSPRSGSRRVRRRAASERPGLDFPRREFTEEERGTYEVVIHSRSAGVILSRLPAT